MGFEQAIKTCFLKYADFTGRAPRSEFWYFFLFAFLLRAAGQYLDSLVLGPSPGLFTFGQAAGAAIFLPMIAVGARRFHDIDQSGWWFAGLYLGYFIGYGVLGLQAGAVPGPDAFGRAQEQLWGVLIFLMFACMIGIIVATTRRGTWGPNRYGDNPLMPMLTDAS
jgi:uncharacterized membrane protein YhaH (DUF805 family)